jgi:hypothetical protein
VFANAVFHHDVAPIFPRRGDMNCVKKHLCDQHRGQEKTRTVTARRHDTLCVRTVCSLFLLEQYLAAFGDSNPGGKTTLIVTINTSVSTRRYKRNRVGDESVRSKDGDYRAVWFALGSTDKE